MDNNKSGFSLVELSVTLVVIGLVMAAITSGVHLLQAAKINKITSEITGYVTAVNSFKDKYRAWPGDMPNATSFWGVTAIAGDGKTADGDGNEKIEGNNTERLRSWQHLSLSGMIAGNYTGEDAGTPDHKTGVNLPASTIKTANYLLGSNSTTFYTTFGTFLQLGSITGDVSSHNSALSPADAHIIDAKIDDGLADTGDIYVLRGAEYAATTGKCADAAAGDASANYILTDNTISCRLIYWLNKL